MKLALVPAAAALALAFPLVAGAQMISRDSQVAGPYIGADLGQAKFKASCGGFSGCDDKDTAWRVFGGYQFNRNLGAEVGYTDLGSVAGTAPGVSSRADAHAWELTGVGSIPIVGGLSAYGKLGAYYGKVEATGTAGALSSTASETNTGLTYALGAQYDFTRNLGVRAQWQRYDNMGGNSTGETDVDSMTVGVVFRFQ